jgi:hypothetical protein
MQHIKKYKLIDGCAVVTNGIKVEINTAKTSTIGISQI